MRDFLSSTAFEMMCVWVVVIVTIGVLTSGFDRREAENFNRAVEEVTAEAKSAIAEMEESGYLPDAEKFELIEEIEHSGYHCTIDATEEKQLSGEKVFIAIRLFGGSSFTTSTHSKLILETGIVE